MNYLSFAPGNSGDKLKDESVYEVSQEQQAGISNPDWLLANLGICDMPWNRPQGSREH